MSHYKQYGAFNIEVDFKKWGILRQFCGELSKHFVLKMESKILIKSKPRPTTSVAETAEEEDRCVLLYVRMFFFVSQVQE